jgi:UPF0042 nucleotide-binding protein
VDGLPPELIATMVDLGARAKGDVTRIAVVMDVRSRAFSADLGAGPQDLDAPRLPAAAAVLEASDPVLVRRFEQVRRSHPLQGDGRLVDSISAERALLGPLRDAADLIVDTSTVRPGPAPAARAGLRGASAGHRVSIVSFGFKYGLPMDADLVDGPAVPAQPALDPRAARPAPVATTTSRPRAEPGGAVEFVDRYLELLALVVAEYRREGKRYLTLAVGCTGSKHRSVAISGEGSVAGWSRWTAWRCA